MDAMNKAEYQKRIWTYRKRREGLKRKTRNLSKKIRQWEQYIRNRSSIRKDKKEIGALVKKVNEYFDVDIRSSLRANNHSLARNVYYKVGFDEGFCGTHLSQHIGRYKRKALIGRNILLTSFKHSQKNKDAYHNFRNFIKNNNP